MNGKPLWVEVKGLDELKSAMRLLPNKIRMRAVYKGLGSAGKIVRDEAVMRAPSLKKNTKYRKTGTLKRAIALRRSKDAARLRMVGVFINVRPLKSALRSTRSARKRSALGTPGAQNPNDPFYWRFVEFGTNKMDKKEFLAKAAKKLDPAREVFIETATSEINKLNTRP